MTSTTWYHKNCSGGAGDDWIDGHGVVHCDCRSDNIFNLRFECASNKEAKQFQNFLDLRKTILGISMSLDGADDDDVEAMDDWI